MKAKDLKKMFNKITKDDFNDIDVLDYIIKELKFKRKELKYKEANMFKLAKQEIANMRMFHPDKFPPGTNITIRSSQLNPNVKEDCDSCINKDICPSSTAKSTVAMDKHKH